MMENKFHIIFSLRVYHSFFEHNKCRCVGFSATNDTRKLLNKFGFLINKKCDGFDLLMTSGKNTEPLFNYIQKVTTQNYLEFEIVNTDTDFYSFTDLPIDRLVQLYYDTVKVINQGETGLRDLVVKYIPQSTPPRFGTLRINFESIVNQRASGKENIFQMSFEARSTQWQYYVVNNSAVVLSNPSISGKPEVIFSEPVETKTEEGQTALLFSSGENLLALSEVPKYRFDLINKRNGTSKSGIANAGSTKTIFKGLPNPHRGRLAINTVDGKNIVSSLMYVYI